MYKKIFKYQLEIKGYNQIEMTKGAEILSIQTQNEVPCIWALVDENAEKEIRVFEIFETGQHVPTQANRKYIGTFQLEGGSLVFHCFELL